MREKRKGKRKKDLIQITLLIALLFFYAHYESKRKEEMTQRDGVFVSSEKNTDIRTVKTSSPFPFPIQSQPGEPLP